MDNQKPAVRPVALGLALAAALLRLVPHPPNFAPVGALALFSGARLAGWQAYLVPLLAMAITDPILSRMAGYPAYSSATLIIYGSFLISVLLGRTFLRSTNSPARIGAVALLASTQFFLITNFGVWLGALSLYPRTFAGLLECYVAALPFFGRTILADLFYTAVLFGAYSLLNSRLEHREAQS